MKRPTFKLAGSALMLMVFVAACGQNTTERAATGALGGAVVAGPIGAAVGGAVGVLR